MTEELEELTANRINWIRELRSGEWNQANGYLFMQHEYSQNRYYCCIGVACSIKGFSDDYLDDEEGYDEFCYMYGVDNHLKQYLMAMNDGAAYRSVEKAPFIGNYGIDGKLIRQKAPNRDFKFIARFLEIVWGLDVR